LKRLYETIFIINPDSDNAVLEQTIADVRNLIESNGYEVKRLDPWGRRRLAYEVRGQTEGYYVLMVFESEADFIEQLQRYYRITESIIKYMVVKFEGDLTQLLPEMTETEEKTENQSEEVGNVEPGYESAEA
jgi:small subunit ribosomal protein S6